MDDHLIDFNNLDSFEFFYRPLLWSSDEHISSSKTPDELQRHLSQSPTLHHVSRRLHRARPVAESYAVTMI